MKYTGSRLGETRDGALTSKRCAPGEDRTHGLQIMRLTRCLLRYRGRWVHQRRPSSQHRRGEAAHRGALGGHEGQKDNT